MSNPERPTDPMWLAQKIRQLESDIIALKRVKPQQLRYWEDATEETTTNSVHQNLGDAITVILPENGLIEVLYQAAWKNTTLGQGSAALYVDNASLVVAALDNASPITSYAGSDDVYRPIVTWPGFGLRTIYLDSGVNSAWAGDATTGQAVGGQWRNTVTGENFDGGGWVPIFATAGSHTISVRYAATSGTTSVQNRRMWVRTVAAPANVS